MFLSTFLGMSGQLKITWCSICNFFFPATEILRIILWFPKIFVLLLIYPLHQQLKSGSKDQMFPDSFSFSSGLLISSDFLFLFFFPLNKIRLDCLTNIVRMIYFVLSFFVSLAELHSSQSPAAQQDFICR
jgi:hypothetical protein